MSVGESSERVTARVVEPRAIDAQAIAPRAFALELTKGCNLRCGYCYYADRDDAYDPATRMSRAVAERSVDLLLASAAGDDPVHVHLFGGEPLLDFALLRHVVQYGARRAAALERRITFEVTTNGTRLEADVIEFLNEHRVHVGVSFDGPPAVQDVARPLAHGSSHALALPKIRALLASRAGTDLADRTHCSVVLTRRELDFAGIVRHLEEIGFRKIVMTPATDRAGGSVGFRDEDLPAVGQAFDALAAEYERAVSAHRRVAATWFPRLMGRILSGERRTQFCRGGLDYLGVAADGTVSLCYRFFDKPDYAMGSVQAGIDRAVTERLVTHPTDERTTCSRCWARYFCGGGCHHDNVTTMGAPATPNPIACDIFRHSMGRALEAWGRLSRTGALPRRAAQDNGATTIVNDEHAIFEDARPARAPGLYERDLDGERVVYDPATHEVVVLNETAAFIFGLCDGTRTTADFVTALARRYAAPPERLRDDLGAALRDLRERRLVTG
jgi:uncharacterized protein